MEILNSVISILILEMLMLFEVFVTFKLYFLFRKRIEDVGQRKKRNKEYTKVSLYSIFVEVVGFFIVLFFFQKNNTNLVMGVIAAIVFFGVLVVSILYRRKWIKPETKYEVAKISIPYNAIGAEVYKALFICALTDFTMENYIFIMRISSFLSFILLLLTVIVFIKVVPFLFKTVKCQPYPSAVNIHKT